MHVGMNRARSSGLLRGARVPHARGDEPMEALTAMDTYESSPCTWG